MKLSSPRRGNVLIYDLTHHRQLESYLIADNFNKLSAFMEDVPDYLRLPNGIYVRKDSALVNMAGLGSDYK